MKEVKKEYLTIDSYMLQVMVVDFVLKEELKIDIESDEKSKEWYDNFKKKKKKQNINL